MLAQVNLGATVDCSETAQRHGNGSEKFGSG